MMRVVEFHSEDGVRLASRPEPEVAPTLVLVDVRRVGICGTDLGAVQRGNPRFSEGIVIGHELVGVRRDTGARVTANPITTCGECVQCARGREELCAEKSILGAHVDGVMASSVALPEAQLAVLPDRVSDAQAALVEPMATALHAWRRASIVPNSSVGIIGAGAIGLCLLAAARAEGGAIVHLAEIDASKHSNAHGLGAASTVKTFDDGDTFEAVFDTVGAAATRRSAVSSTIPGGPTVFVGLHEIEMPLNGNDVVTNERNLLGSFAYTHDDFLDAIDLVADMPVDWVTEIRFEDAADVINGVIAPPQGTNKMHVVL